MTDDDVKALENSQTLYMLERLYKHTHVCYLHGFHFFSSQISIHKNCQEKTAFTAHLILSLIEESYSFYAILMPPFTHVVDIPNGYTSDVVSYQ
jgi:hypothetical protein